MTLACCFDLLNEYFLLQPGDIGQFDLDAVTVKYADCSCSSTTLLPMLFTQQPILIGNSVVDRLRLR